MENKHLVNRKVLKPFRSSLRKKSPSAEAALWSILKSKNLDGRKFRRQLKIKHLSLILLLMGIILVGWIVKPEKRFKIITYNVWNGFIDGIHPTYPCYHVGKERKDGIYNWLKKQNADVVVFQELIDYTPQKLKKESSFWGHEFAVTLKDKGMAIGITSRYPINIKEVLTTGMHHGLIYCNIEGIDIIGVHLWPRFDEKILDEVNIVEQRVSESFNNDIPVIVLGDFNAFSPEDDPYITRETIDLYNHWNWKLENGRPSYRVIQSLLDLGLKDLYAKFRNRKYYEGGRYDFIFASPALAEKCLKATHPDNKKFLKLSDHFPVSAEFEWE